MTGVHGLAALRQAMTDYLTAQGVESMTAWPKDRVGALTAPLAVVQVKEVEAGSAGFQNYLGQRYDAETRSWTEAFGQKVSVKFLVTLYSPGRTASVAAGPWWTGWQRRFCGADRRGSRWRSGPWARRALTGRAGAFAGRYKPSAGGC